MQDLEDALNAHGAQHERSYDYDAITSIPLEGCSGRLLLTAHRNDPTRLAALEKTHGVHTSVVFWSPDQSLDGRLPFPRSVIREFLPVNDPCHSNQPEEFALIVEDMHKAADGTLGFLDRDLRSGRTVLLSCTMGVSRSPTLALLYLILRDARRGKCHTKTLSDYVWALKTLRPTVAPDLCFLELLDAYLGRQRAPAQDHAIDLPFTVWTPPGGGRALKFYEPPPLPSPPLTPTASFSDSQTQSQ